MKQKLKLRISEKAYDYLLKEVKSSEEYSHLRLSQGNGCCKSAKVDLILDNPTLDDIEDAVEDIPIIYDKSLIEGFNEIIIIFKNSSLMIKTVPNPSNSPKNLSLSCHSNNKGCGGCGGCKSSH